MVWLPQALDVALVAVGFYWFGSLCRQNSEYLKRYWTPLAGIAFSFWMICVQNGYYLEMATRSYPQFVVSLLAALAGSVCVMLLAKALEASFAEKYFSLIGRHTLLLMCVHQLDGFDVWQGIISADLFAKSCIRIAVDLFGTFIVYWLYRKMFQRRTLKEYRRTD